MKKWSAIFGIALFLATSTGIYVFWKFVPLNNSSFFNIDIDSRVILVEIDEKFLSVALDVSFMRCYFHKFNDSNWETLEKLSSLLSPAYLRFGGTDADRTIYDIHGSNRPFTENISCKDYSPTDNVIITGKDWIKFNKFVQKSRLNLIVDLNVLLRSNSHWNSSNAEALIKFSEEHGFPLDFELGNEPNSFPHVFQIKITGSELSKDFYALKKILNSTKAYRDSKLIGPDVTRPKNLGSSSLKFLDEFLANGNNADVISWHQYYLNGRTATLDDFLNLGTFNLLLPEIESVFKIVRNHSKTVPIWISETSSAYGGGAPTLSNSFVASFLWLDKLGVAAQQNISVVIRQSLFKNYYALIDDNLTPLPDFWISLLYKKLVGRQVLKAKLFGDKISEFVRLYAHCLASNSTLNGTVVIYGLNLSNQTELFVPSGLTVTYPIYSYIFKPKYSDLKTKSVLLNDQVLTYNPNIAEDMLNMAIKVNYPLFIPPHSIGFWVIKEVTESVCQR